MAVTLSPVTPRPFVKSSDSKSVDNATKSALSSSCGPVIIITLQLGGVCRGKLISVSKNSPKMCRVLIVLATLAGIVAQPLFLLVPHAFAQASGQGQAHSRARSVVSRVAFRYIVGSAIDLPLTLRPCPTAEERDAAYDIVKRIIAGERSDRTMREGLCHPHFGRSQVTNRDDGSVTFDLPAKYCDGIKETVERILEDQSTKSYTELVDRPKQALINRVFEIISVYGSHHGFPNTSGTGHSKYFAFLPQDCVTKGERAQFVILMHRRKRTQEEHKDAR
jgi:hypothetical protein